MLYFNCDYTEGAHPRVLEKMLETNLEQTVGYGEDPYCEAARELIRRECQRQDVDVQFLVGGTQTNFTVIRAALRPYQGGALPGDWAHQRPRDRRGGGHRPQGAGPAHRPRGKSSLPPSRRTPCVKAHWAGRGPGAPGAAPKWCTSAHPTEKRRPVHPLAELEALHPGPARKHGLYLFLDGGPAGLRPDGPGQLTSPWRTWPGSATCSTLEGTKCGRAARGGRVVLANPELAAGLPVLTSSRTAACWPRGRLLGLQFLALV